MGGVCWSLSCTGGTWQPAGRLGLLEQRGGKAAEPTRAHTSRQSFGSLLSPTLAPMRSPVSEQRCRQTPPPRGRDNMGRSRSSHACKAKAHLKAALVHPARLQVCSMSTSTVSRHVSGMPWQSVQPSAHAWKFQIGCVSTGKTLYSALIVAAADESAGIYIRQCVHIAKT